MPTHVVFVGPDIFSSYGDMVRGLKQVGATVSGIGMRPAVRLDADLKRHLDAYVHVGDLASPDAIVAAARDLARGCPIDLLETGDEALVVPVAQARAALGLPGLSVRTATLCRDKAAMKETLRAAGVPCAASEAVASLDAARRFAEREGFPVIIKPRSAGSARRGPTISRSSRRPRAASVWITGPRCRSRSSSKGTRASTTR